MSATKEPTPRQKTLVELWGDKPRIMYGLWAARYIEGPSGQDCNDLTACKSWEDMSFDEQYYWVDMVEALQVMRPQCWPFTNFIMTDAEKEQAEKEWVRESSILEAARQTRDNGGAEA